MLVFAVSSAFTITIAMVGLLGQAEAMDPRSNPLCLLNQCDPSGLLGAFALICDSTCKLSNYTGGICSGPSDQFPNRNHAQCTCSGDYGVPVLNVVNLTCPETCASACTTCGYDGLQSNCPVGPPPGNTFECVCGGEPLPPIIPGLLG